ncbi:hypothetical protein [Namhaeicola litoreus]|uniref:Uncharacterized protein n=1 Tax=Namhaeicola litoreus TaxID=1052145 RepID=A0ABW3Y275_9FLAO
MENKKDITQFTLIDGKFTPKEAKEILLYLVFSKINFHARKNLGAVERLGEPDSLSEKRMEQLFKTEKDIKAFLDDHLGNDKKLVIKSSIDISFE